MERMGRRMALLLTHCMKFWNDAKQQLGKQRCQEPFLQAFRCRCRAEQARAGDEEQAPLLRRCTCPTRLTLGVRRQAIVAGEYQNQDRKRRAMMASISQLGYLGLGVT